MYDLVQKCGLKFIPTVKNPIEYNYGPRSVAIGDFNNYTWLDMVLPIILLTILLYILDLAMELFQVKSSIQPVPDLIHIWLLLMISTMIIDWILQWQILVPIMSVYFLDLEM